MKILLAVMIVFMAFLVGCEKGAYVATNCRMVTQMLPGEAVGLPGSGMWYPHTYKACDKKWVPIP